MNIKDSVALVTGGASGLGAAAAKHLVAAGGKVVLADLNEDKGASRASELGDAATFVKTDVTDAEQVQAAIDAASKLGTLRAVVQCAGVGWAARTVNKKGEPHDLGLYQKVVAVNQVGHFNVLRLAAAAMSKNDAGENGERGVVVFTASVAAYDGQIGQIAYAASKAAVVGMTLPAARDLSPVGIRVMTIAPGVFDTPMMALLPEPAKEALAKTVVFPKRLGDPAYYAQLVGQIVENPYLNGEVIRLDGALRMPPK
jgi:NAD(P)-dependent dehydrogenase (short-subunit alcohol dehydrogenase family)